MTTNWRTRAACAGSFGLFTIPRSKDAYGQRRFIARAKAICATCPVRTDCAAEGETNGDNHSIYGGLTPAERRGARNTIPISHGTPSGYKTHYSRGERPCDDCRDAFYGYRDRKGTA